MKEILQEVKEELEKAYDQPESHDLDHSIQQLQSALEQNRDKGTMIKDVITALTQARNSKTALENAGDVSSAASFGQAFNALEHAIESYS
jgi:hypothetical protein